MTAEVRKVKLDAKRIQSSVLNFDDPSTLSEIFSKRSPPIGIESWFKTSMP